MTLRPLIACVLALLLATSAYAESGPTLVQLAPLVAPVAQGGEALKTTLTPYLRVGRASDVAVVCRYLPRVRESMALALSRAPVRRRRGRLDLARAAAMIRAAINRSLGHRTVSAVYLAPGARPIGLGGQAQKLPGAALGCQRVRRIPGDIDVGAAD